MVHNIHKHNQLLVFFILERIFGLSESVKSTDALTRRAPADNIHTALWKEKNISSGTIT
jgi:hypothetical protein